MLKLFDWDDGPPWMLVRICAVDFSSLISFVWDWIVSSWAPVGGTDFSMILEDVSIRSINFSSREFDSIRSDDVFVDSMRSDDVFVDSIFLVRLDLRCPVLSVG